MTPTPEHYETVRGLNDLLRQELGQPQHAWLWSEDLTVSMRIPDKYDHKVDKDTGLVILCPVFATRRQLPFHPFRWVLCVKGYVPEDEWLQSIGTRMEYPANGMWQVIGTPTGPLALNHGEIPSAGATWEAIRSIRQERSVTAATFKNLAQDAADAKDTKGDSERLARIKDAMCAFGGIPGRKGHVSFPTPGRQVTQ